MSDRTAKSRRTEKSETRSSHREVGVALDVPEIPRYLRFDEIPAELLEPLRSIVNRYELRSGEPMPSPIAVTSALPNEVTTMVSQALATLLAHELGKFVLWMDCSWLSRDAAYDPEAGSALLEILADGTKVLSEIRSSPELPHLNRLVAGNVPTGQRHMIGRSEEFERLLAVLASEFDYLILDAPPLLGSGDGLPLLRRSQGYIMVARQRSTTVSQVREAVELAEPTRNIGVVLADFDTRIPRFIRRIFGD